ncbi:sigma-54-dependent transcriptional regulator [Dyella sp. KRB-257]|uniref:sigma-54-dependent transcriptional regulator n=1 Tax=Dyella sp. KRB-257 TaxID=3400915 RepID=UPI003C0E46BE
MPPTSPAVLLIDDDASFAQAFSSYAKIYGCEVAIATTIKRAVPMLRQHRAPDLVVLDLSLPDGSGLDLMHQVPRDTIERLVVVTGDPCADTARRAQQFPIIEYVVKPLRRRLLNDLFRRASDNARSRGMIDREGACATLRGRSRAMTDLRQRIRRIATYEDTVLLQGASGTGKELAARAIHTLSGRGGSFIAVNCGASQGELLGSHLFGHKRGSFTGAIRDHRGYFEQAMGGTLFLDEITEMPLDLQPYLLRVLESRTVTPIGASHARDVDVRVVAACNVDPMVAMAQGRLRPDLYYRLAQFPIRMPALAERPEDIVPLAEEFLDALNRRHGQAKYFSAASLHALQQRSWPGNVRELKHVVRLAFILSEHDEIDASEMEPVWTQPSDAAQAPNGTLEEIERQVIFATLARYGDNKTLAARHLGVSVKTIYNKLDRYRGRP